MDTHKSSATSVNAGFAAGWRQLNRTLLTLAEDYVGWLDALWLERLNASTGHKPELSIGILLWPGFPLMSLTGIVEALRHAADFGDQSRPLYCRWSIMGGSDTSASCGLRVQADAPYTNPTDFDYIAIIGGLLPQLKTAPARHRDYLRVAARTSSTKAAASRCLAACRSWP